MKTCGKTFCRKTTLTKHLRRAHQQGAPLALDQMASTPSDSDESDDEEEFVPRRIRDRGYCNPQTPLTPPESSRRSSDCIGDRYGQSQPLPHYGYFPHTPQSLGRPFTAQSSQSQYRGGVGEVTDVFAAVDHGNDYSFFRDINNNNTMLSPALSRGSAVTEYFSPGFHTAGSSYNECYTPSSHHLMARSQSDYVLNAGLGIHLPCHGQASFSMPPTWLEASRTLQYVTSADVESSGSSENASAQDQIDGGPLEPAVILASQPESSSAHYHRASKRMAYDSNQYRYPRAARA